MGTELDPGIARKFSLHKYQSEISEFVLRTPRCGLFLPVGAGKTRIVLAALTQLRPRDHVLVIAPSSVARLSWAEEISKLGLDMRYKSFVTGPRGGKTVPRKKRLQMYASVKDDPPTLYTISRDLTTDIVDYFGKDWPFPILIVDELQSFKDPSSQRFKALRKIAPYTYRFVGLTGTPAPKGLTDLWSQIWLMDAGRRLGPTITRYRTAFFNEGMHVNGRCVDWVPKSVVPLLTDDLQVCYDQHGYARYPQVPVDARTAIQERIKDIVVSVDIKDQVKLPDLIDARHLIPLDDDELARYKEMAKEQVLLLTPDDPDSDAVIAKNAAALSQKLVQMASGNLYVDAEHNFVTIHTRKLDMLHYIDDNEPTPILVAYWFKSDLAMIRKDFPDAVAFSGEPAIKAKWDAGKIKMMLIHPKSVGAGLNLQKGGHTLVWYTLPWDLEAYIQTVGRVYRQGQTETTVVHSLLAKGTIDERIPKVLDKKDITQKDLIDAIRMDVT